MKYGIAVRIVETGYVEIEADCEAEAKAMAEDAALDGRVLCHEAEVESVKVESVCCSEEIDLKNPYSVIYYCQRISGQTRHR